MLSWSTTIKYLSQDKRKEAQKKREKFFTTNGLPPDDMEEQRLTLEDDVFSMLWIVI